MLKPYHATTIVCVRRPAAGDGADDVAIAGDGQVSLGETIAKGDAVKIRRLEELGAEKRGVLVGFAGSVADAFALLDRFEAKLKQSPTNLMRAAIELAKIWRTDKALRRLESLLAVADLERSLMISGQGDVIEPSDGIIAIGSGGSFALAAARALAAHTEMSAAGIAERSLQIAAEICVFTNAHISVEQLGESTPSERG